MSMDGVDSYKVDRGLTGQSLPMLDHITQTSGMLSVFLS